MNSENLNKSIILIGPKGVGKSLIAERLQNMLKSNNQDFFLLKLDVIRDLCKKLYDPQSKLAPQEIIKLDKEYIELNNLFNLESSTFKNIISRFYQIFNYQEDPNSLFKLSNNGLIAFDNLISLNILEACLNKIDKPLIIDAGGNIGPIIDNVPSSDKFLVLELKDGDKQKRLLTKFGNVVYLAPGEDYEKSSLSSINDEANKAYRKNPNSYKSFANIIIEVSNLFSDNTGFAFKTRDADDAQAQSERFRLLNNDTVNKICKQIIDSAQLSENQPGS